MNNPLVSRIVMTSLLLYANEIYCRPLCSMTNSLQRPSFALRSRNERPQTAINKRPSNLRWSILRGWMASRLCNSLRKYGSVWVHISYLGYEYATVYEHPGVSIDIAIKIFEFNQCVPVNGELIIRGRTYYLPNRLSSYKFQLHVEFYEISPLNSEVKSLSD